MRLTSGKIPSSLSMVLLVLITWYQWQLISASMVSLGTSLILLPMSINSPTRLWNANLFEFWIATIVWVALAVFLTTVLLKPARTLHPFTSGAALFLCLLVFVALASPFLVPVPPNVQGNLLTTRLLPPLSSGYVIQELAVGDSGENSNSIERTREEANSFLLQRTITVAGNKESEKGHPILFILGTDDTGRDVFSRIIAGTRVSLAIGIAASLGALIIGTLFGFASGYSGRFVDSVLMRITDLFLSVPSLFLVVGIIAFLGQSISTLILVLATTGWMAIARMVRAEVKTLREREFVHAARMLNLSSTRIVVRHILPNVKGLLVTTAVLQFGSAVLAEASLSFLGLGVQPPTASWGNMLGQSLGYLRTGWWLGVFPGLLLAGVLIAAHYAIEGRKDTHG